MLGIIYANGTNDGFEELGKQYDPLILPIKNVPIIVKEINWLAAQGCHNIEVLVASSREADELRYLLDNLATPKCNCDVRNFSERNNLQNLSLAAENEPVLFVDTCFDVNPESTEPTLQDLQHTQLIVDHQQLPTAYLFASWQECCSQLQDPHWNTAFAAQAHTTNITHLATELSLLKTLDDYLKAKQIKNSRAMNSVLLAEDYVIKTSSDKKKMVSEYNWFQNLPPELQQYVPKMLACDFFSSKETASYTMERLKLVDLKSLFIFSSGTFALWQTIFQQCFDLLDLLSQYQFLGKGSFMMANYHKTIDRLHNLPLHLHTHPETIQQFLDAFLKISQDIDSQGQENIVHGDYYLGNIMYDVKLNQIKLIDPRGTLFGSRFYDIAKLCKAVLYQYDYIDNELYLHNPDTGRSLFYDRGKEAVRKLFTEQFLYPRFNGQELYYIKMVVASLYLSMIPIHYHNPINQQLFYNTFENIFQEIRTEFKDLIG